MTAQVSVRARPAVSCNKEPVTVNTRLYRLFGVFDGLAVQASHFHCDVKGHGLFVPDDAHLDEVGLVEAPGDVEYAGSVVLDPVRDAGRYEHRGPRGPADRFASHGEQSRAVDHVVPLVRVRVVVQQVNVARLEPGQADHHPFRSGQVLGDQLDHPPAVPGIAAGLHPFAVLGVTLVDDRLLAGDHGIPGSWFLVISGVVAHEMSLLGGRGTLSGPRSRASRRAVASPISLLAPLTIAT